jgi:putative membrane protein
MAKALIKRGLRKLKPSKIVRPFDTKERIILRDYLAMQRTTLANERTLFAYIRTSLYLILSGIGLLGLEEFEELNWVGYLSLGLSAVIIIYGVIRYYMLRHKLRNFYDTIGMQAFEEENA